MAIAATTPLVAFISISMRATADSGGYMYPVMQVRCLSGEWGKGTAGRKQHEPAKAARGFDRRSSGPVLGVAGSPVGVRKERESSNIEY